MAGLARLQQHRRERRRERQRAEGRQQHRDRDRQRELLVHPAGEAADERHRDEHRGEDERDADDRRPTPPSSPGCVASFGAMPCSMWCITASTTTIASSTTMPIASTRPNIDSVFTEKPSSGKKMNVPMQRDRHGEERDDRRAEVLQEDEDDQRDEDDRLEEGVDDRLDRRLDRRRRVVDDLVVHVGREEAPSPCFMVS